MLVSLAQPLLEGEHIAQLVSKENHTPLEHILTPLETIFIHTCTMVPVP
jgi:hypothetical protein